MSEQNVAISFDEPTLQLFAYFIWFIIFHGFCLCMTLLLLGLSRRY